jgi:hypothetical protein
MFLYDCMKTQRVVLHKGLQMWANKHMGGSEQFAVLWFLARMKAIKNNEFLLFILPTPPNSNTFCLSSKSIFEVSVN